MCYTIRRVLKGGRLAFFTFGEGQKMNGDMVVDTANPFGQEIIGAFEKPVILIIEDTPFSYTLMRRLLEKRFKDFCIIVAKNLTEALRVIKDFGRNLKAVALDSCLDSSEPNTMHLIEEIKRANSQTKILATSSDAENRRSFVLSGCHGHCEKWNFHNALAEYMSPL